MYAKKRRRRRRRRRRKTHFLNGIANALEDAIWFVFLMVPSLLSFTISKANSLLASRIIENILNWMREKHPSLALHFILYCIYCTSFHSENCSRSLWRSEIFCDYFGACVTNSMMISDGHFEKEKKKKNLKKKMRMHELRDVIFFSISCSLYLLFAPTRFILLWYSSHGYYKTQNDHSLFSMAVASASYFWLIVE